jgi:hypothetical protein
MIKTNNVKKKAKKMKINLKKEKKMFFQF